jgi:hypothetical protein
MSERTNTDVVQQGYEAFGRGDIPAVLDLLTDDVEWIQQGPPVIPFPALATDTRESRSTSPCSMKTSNLSSSSLASSSPKATSSSSWVLSVVSARRRATRSSKSGHTSTRSGTARSPRGGFLKTQRHTLLRFIVVGFERSVSVGRAEAYNVSVLPFTPYSPECVEEEFCEVRAGHVRLASCSHRASLKGGVHLI